MKTNSNQIISAAALIADIDPALARVWLIQPFNRHGIVTAFHRALSNCPRYEGVADRIAVCLRSAIDSAKKELPKHETSNRVHENQTEEN